MRNTDDIVDVFVIGGGVNGCGIARDLTGRGLTVALAEMSDLGWATSSSSTKLFHGGLRYLEYFEFRLVREALVEREILLRAMPHISWPMRFVLPYHKDMRFESSTPTSRLLSFVAPWMKGRRPAWLIRLGLFLYDNMGGRKILPGTRSLDLRKAPEGAPLDDRFVRAYEYSDCWIEDSRLVVLNARDAEARGAEILVRTKVVSAERSGDFWTVTTEDAATQQRRQHRARMLVNAAGPWVADIIHGALRINSSESVRLVRGSHIVTKRLFDHDKCYFLQGKDGRIIFVIPYETDFTLIGTTDADHQDASETPVCTPEEEGYLINFVNQYFKTPLSSDDVLWRFAGVRPLYDDGAENASAATRDYVLTVDQAGGAPVLNVFGGKITTYRKLADAVADKVGTFFPSMNASWTASAPLPGGAFAHDQVGDLVATLRSDFPFLSESWALRLVRAYGVEASAVLGDAKAASDLGEEFGATLTAREVDWLIRFEFARSADDVLWRRTKLGLRFSESQSAALERWMSDRLAPTIVDKQIGLAG